MLLLNTYKNPDFSHQTVENRRKITSVHFHDSHELYYLINGSTKYFIADKIFQIESGGFVLIPAGISHKTDSENCLVNERILVSFKSDDFNKNTLNALNELFAENVIYIPKSKLEMIENIFSKIETENMQKDKYSDFLINSCIEEIIIQLARLRQKHKPYISEADNLIHRISKHITDNYSQDLSLENLGNIFSISTSHLSRRFKAVAGISINEYITYVRISNAERLLKSTDLSITKVAELCGFNDSNYFSTVFKKIKGITPLKYSHKFRKEITLKKNRP